MKRLFVFAALGLSILPSFGAEQDSPSAPASPPYALKDDLVNRHPRLLVTPQELDAVIRHYREDPAFFAPYLRNADQDLDTKPVPLTKSPGTQRLALALAKLAVAYRVTGEAKYLECLQRWQPDLESYKPIVFDSVWGPSGLTSGHVLLGAAIAYDVLQGHAPESLVNAFRSVIQRQAAANYKALSSLKSIPYEQNHYIIPTAGLAMAALALLDEDAQAQAWGAFAHAALDKSRGAIAHDGWFFEGYSYWDYTMQFPACYAMALKNATGEDWFATPPFAGAAEYVAHMTLPGHRWIFDFGDTGPRVNHDGVTAQEGYDKPWHTYQKSRRWSIPALIFHGREDNGFLTDMVGGIAASEGSVSVTIDALLGLLLQVPFPGVSPQMKASYPGFPPYHYFPDMEVVHWRQNWSDPKATAIAFKSGPPAGHHFTELVAADPAWKPALGHAHPDAGSFILFSKGVFLANDTGYTGMNLTQDHNSILVDGEGQSKRGLGSKTFAEKAYAEYDKIHMEDVWFGSEVMAAAAVFGDAYGEEMKITRMDRSLVMVNGKYIVISDHMESRLPHRYTWQLHTDQKAVPAGERRFLMENGPARLIVESLSSLNSWEVKPTVVETQLHLDELPPRPQQRGFHIALHSDSQNNFSFLTALCVQSASEEARSVQIARSENGSVVFEDGKTRCEIWAEPSPALNGKYAYVIRENGRIRQVGLYGNSLRVPGMTLEAEAPQGVELVRVSSDAWQAAGQSLAAKMRLEIDGEVQKIQTP